MDKKWGNEFKRRKSMGPDNKRKLYCENSYTQIHTPSEKVRHTCSMIEHKRFGAHSMHVLYFVYANAKKIRFRSIIKFPIYLRSHRKNLQHYIITLAHNNFTCESLARTDTLVKVLSSSFKVDSLLQMQISFPNKII